MRVHARKLFTSVAAAGVALAAFLAPGAATTADAHSGDHPDGHHHRSALTVMTRNIYLGADIQRPLRAIAGETDPATIVVKLANANAVTRAIVDQTKFPRRAQLLTSEIAATRPDLIALQEVALWRHGPLELDKLGVANAETVDYDYLQILLDDLHAAGLHYRAVKVQQESDVEAPSFVGVPPNISNAQDVRLTMRDVVLMKDRRGLSLLRTGAGHYSPASTLSLTIAGLTLSFQRGFAWADVRVGSRHDGRVVRFIDTHLEAFGSNFALAQAQELLAGPASARGRTTIIACDCNSDPLNSTLSNGVEHRAPYDFIVGQGFTDEWLQWAPAEQGWTSGLSELVNDPTPAGFDHRIDMIFARTAHHDGLRVRHGEVTGTTLASRDPVENVWPSDHGGVVLKLALKHR